MQLRAVLLRLLLLIRIRPSSVQRLLMLLKHTLSLGDFGLERWCLGLELPQGRGGKLQSQCKQGRRAQRRRWTYRRAPLLQTRAAVPMPMSADANAASEMLLPL